MTGDGVAALDSNKRDDTKWGFFQKHKLQQLTYTNNKKRIQILRKKPSRIIQRRVFVMDEFAGTQHVRAHTLLLLS